MASKTSLQLVNKVLLNLRESSVTDFSSTYAQLILEFINQAKEKVEAAWQWKVLTTTLQFNTVASQTLYTLASAASPAVTSTSGLFPLETAEVLKDEEGNWCVYDATNASTGGFIRLGRYTQEVATAYNIYLANQAPVQPNAFAYSYGATASGVPGASLLLVGAPTGSRTMQVRMKVPQDEFSLGSEVLLVPWRPVVSFATFIAMEERGEELSERSTLYKDRHDQELQRAIDRDDSGEEAYSQLKNYDTGSGMSLYAGAFNL